MENLLKYVVSDIKELIKLIKDFNLSDNEETFTLTELEKRIDKNQVSLVFSRNKR